MLVIFASSADVNPEHHIKIVEALIMTGGLAEVQVAPGRKPIFTFCVMKSSWLIFLIINQHHEVFINVS